MATSVSYLETQQEHISALGDAFAAQQKAYRANPMPTLEQRRNNLAKLKQAVLDNQNAFIDAINEDFGGRSRHETLIAEIMPIAQDIKATSKKLKKWMKPSKRHVGQHLQPATAKVVYQPLGVIGIMTPWNYPLQLGVMPLIGALAAGNAAMIKMSEFTPRTGELLARVIADTFPPELVTVVNGDAEVAAEFSKLPFDHLLFTGSTHVGKIVMRAAAENLTPVTLELGGKSPAIVSESVPMKDAVERIAFGKSFNAGQTCVAPDYILCPRNKMQDFVDQYQTVFTKMYPQLSGNNDYTSIVNDRQHQRLQGLVEEARDKGAKIHIIGEEHIDDGSRRMPLHIITDATDDMKIMQDEIFGPVLPLVPYDTEEQALEYIRNRPRPLALYYMGYDKNRQEHVLNTTHAGGVCLNDTLMHVAVDDMPFGGIGPSGMGHYHGYEGFQTFSKAKSVFSKPKFNAAKVIYPPYGGKLSQLIFKLFIR